MIKPKPIRIAANNGWASENPPRANAIIPKSIINIEVILDICVSEIRPSIPARINRIPMI